MISEKSGSSARDYLEDLGVLIVGVTVRFNVFALRCDFFYFQRIWNIFTPVDLFGGISENGDVGGTISSRRPHPAAISRAKSPDGPPKTEESYPQKFAD